MRAIAIRLVAIMWRAGGLLQSRCEPAKPVLARNGRHYGDRVDLMLHRMTLTAPGDATIQRVVPLARDAHGQDIPRGRAERRVNRSEFQHAVRPPGMAAATEHKLIDLSASGLPDQRAILFGMS